MSDESNENITKILKQLTNGIQPLLDLTTVQKQNAESERTELLIERAKIEEKIKYLSENLSIVSQKLDTNSVLRKVIDKRIESITGNLSSMINDIKTLEEELAKNEHIKQNQKMMIENGLENRLDSRSDNAPGNQFGNGMRNSLGSNIVKISHSENFDHETSQVNVEKLDDKYSTQPILNPLLNALMENQNSSLNLTQNSMNVGQSSLNLNQNSNYANFAGNLVNGNLTNGNSVSTNQNYNRPNGMNDSKFTNSNNFTRTNSYTNLQSVLPTTIKFEKIENNNNFVSNGFTNLTNTLMTPTQSFTQNISLPIASSSPITSTPQHKSSCDFSIRVTQSQIPLSQSPQIPQLPNGLQQFSLLPHTTRTTGDLDNSNSLSGEGESLGGDSSSRKRDNRGKRVASDTAHQCPVCNKYFASRGSLKTHTFLHSGFKPFKCTFCKHRSATKGQMKIHMNRLHKGEFGVGADGEGGFCFEIEPSNEMELEMGQIGEDQLGNELGNGLENQLENQFV